MVSYFYSSTQARARIDQAWITARLLIYLLFYFNELTNNDGPDFRVVCLALPNATSSIASIGSAVFGGARSLKYVSSTSFLFRILVHTDESRSFGNRAPLRSSFIAPTLAVQADPKARWNRRVQHTRGSRMSLRSLAWQPARARFPSPCVHRQGQLRKHEIRAAAYLQTLLSSSRE